MVGGLRNEEEGAACICVLLVMQHAYEPHVANKLLPSYQGLGPASTPIQPDRLALLARETTGPSGGTVGWFPHQATREVLPMCPL